MSSKRRSINAQKIFEFYDKGTQTCHSNEMKNQDLTNQKKSGFIPPKKSGSGRKNQDHGRIGYKKKQLTQRDDYL